MMTAYYIHHKEDPQSVEFYIADFNKTFNDICAAFKDVTGEDITKGANAKAIQKSCEALKKKIAKKENPERYILHYFQIKTNKLKCPKIPTGCSLDKKPLQSGTFWGNFNRL